MSSDYYTLEKTSEVLGINTAEVNRLRERGDLRAFRDGSNWKFRKAEVDDYLVRVIRSRDHQADDGLLTEDDEEEMPTLLADSASFDALMEGGSGQGPLSISKPMEKKGAGPAKPPVKPAEDDGLSLADDDLMLASDQLTLSDDDPTLLSGATHTPHKESGHSALDLSLGDDDDLLLGGTGTSATSHDATLATDSGLSLSDADDDIVLTSTGSTADGLSLASDSGLSLMDDEVEFTTVEKGGSDDILQLDDEEMLSIADDGFVEMEEAEAGKGFQLEPDKADSPDDSDSSSQVIALEEDGLFGDGGMGFDSSASMFQGSGSFDAGVDNGNATGFSGPSSASTPAATPGGRMPNLDYAPISPTVAPVPVVQEASFGVGGMLACMACSILLVFVLIIMLDLIMNVWSWNRDFVYSSTLVDTLAGLLRPIIPM